MRTGISLGGYLSLNQAGYWGFAGQMVQANWEMQRKLRQELVEYSVTLSSASMITFALRTVEINLFRVMHRGADVT